VFTLNDGRDGMFGRNSLVIFKVGFIGLCRALGFAWFIFTTLRSEDRTRQKS